MHNYSGLDLRKILKLSRNAKCLPSGILLERESSVTFNIVNKINCTVHINKAIGSDNSVFINGVVTSLQPGKDSQINLSGITQLVISRDRRCLGSLLIKQVILDVDGNENHELFYKLGKTSGITVDLNGIYANESAQIYEKDRIESLEVYPPNSYTVKDTIIFNKSAKIIDVKLKDSGNKMVEVYSCDNLAMFANGNDLKASGTNLVLERGSAFGIKDVGPSNGDTYALELGLSNIVGNGMFIIQTVADDRVVGTQSGLIFNSTCKTYKFKLTFPKSRNFYFNIFRDPNSTTGSMLIHSIKLYGEDTGSNIELRDYNAAVQKANYNNLSIAGSAVDGKKVSYREVGNYDLKDQELYSRVKLTSLNFAQVDADTYIDKFNYDISVTFKPLTFNARRWISKFANFTGNIQVNDLMMRNCNKSNKYDITVTDIYNIEEADIIWLEEFIDPLTQKDIDILKGCKTIITTSAYNSQYIRSFVGNKVITLSKFWPFTEFNSRKHQEPYILYLARDYRNTEELLNNVSRISKKVVAVGVRKNYDGCLATYDSTLSYKDLLSLIMYADAVVDLPPNIYYSSAILDLCMIAKKPIVTTNMWIGNSKAKHLLADSYLDINIIRPDINDVINKTNSIATQETNFDMKTYNYNLVGALRTALEEV